MKWLNEKLFWAAWSIFWIVACGIDAVRASRPSLASFDVVIAVLHAVLLVAIAALAAVERRAKAAEGEE